MVDAHTRFIEHVREYNRAELVRKQLEAMRRAERYPSHQRSNYDPDRPDVSLVLLGALFRGLWAVIRWLWKVLFSAKAVASVGKTTDAANPLNDYGLSDDDSEEFREGVMMFGRGEYTEGLRVCWQHIDDGQKKYLETVCAQASVQDVNAAMQRVKEAIVHGVHPEGADFALLIYAIGSVTE